jgi:hypothetical protein
MKIKTNIRGGLSIGNCRIYPYPSPKYLTR